MTGNEGARDIAVEPAVRDRTFARLYFRDRVDHALGMPHRRCVQDERAVISDLIFGDHTDTELERPSEHILKPLRLRKRFAQLGLGTRSPVISWRWGWCNPEITTAGEEEVPAPVLRHAI